MRIRSIRPFSVKGILAASILTIAASSSVEAAGRGTVELELIAAKTYRWDGREYDQDAIAAALAEADAAKSIKKLVLIDPDGETTMADVIDFALLAQPIGAKAYHKVDGDLRKIEISLKP